MNINVPTIFLDTNAFYDFCYLFGKISVVPACINKRVNYDLYKKVLGANLIFQKLYVPPTTVFETISQLRNESTKLKEVIDFLKNIANEYGYHLFNYKRCLEGFGFGYRDTEQIWTEIKKDYNILYNSVDEFVLSKIDSEALIMVLFARIICFTYLIAYHKDTEFYEIAKQEEKTLNRYPMGDAWFKYSKNFTARKLHYYYLNNNEGKKKKEIFDDCLFDVYKRIFDTFDFSVKKVNNYNESSDFGKYIKRNIKETVINKNDVFTLSRVELTKKLIYKKKSVDGFV